MTEAGHHGCGLDLSPAMVALAREKAAEAGVGMSAADVTEIVRRYRLEAEVVRLDDPAPWSAPTRDERFAVVSRRWPALTS